MNTRLAQLLEQHSNITTGLQMINEFGEHTVDKLKVAARQVMIAGCFNDVLGTDDALDVAEWLSSTTGVEISKAVKFLNIYYYCDVAWN